MNISWKYLEKAEYNLKSSKILYDSGQYSSALSLSYYAMFDAANALLSKKIAHIKHMLVQ